MSHDRVENWEAIGRTNRWIISIFIYFNVEEIEKGIHTYIYAYIYIYIYIYSYES